MKMKKTVLTVLSVTAMAVAAEVQVANRANLTGVDHLGRRLVDAAPRGRLNYLFVFEPKSDWER